MKLVLAPMANITHSGFRMLVHTFADPDEYFTEMIHAPSLLAGGAFEQWYLRNNPVADKVVWQLTSNRSDAFADAIPLVLANGGIGIDLNMGCCAPHIVRTGAGFAWMLKPLAETARMIRNVKKALCRCKNIGNKPSEYRLSVKLRLGKTADYSYLLRFCQMLVHEGVSLVTLHPRLQKQSYSSLPQYEYIARLAADLSIPVYGNGDINITGFQKIVKRYPCAGWMIGRAAVQKPWLFQELRLLQCQFTDNSTAQTFSFQPAVQKIDLMKIVIAFLGFLRTEQPVEFHHTRAKRFFQFFCNNFLFAHHCRIKVLQAATCTEIEHIMQEYFEQVPDDRYILLNTLSSTD